MRRIATLLCLCLSGVAWSADSAAEARRVVEQSGVRGGIVVYIGAADGSFTAGLHVNDSYRVQGLATDARQVAAARRYLQSRKLYGPVSVRQWSGGRLPYIDNLVNLVVAERPGAAAMDEMMRVLAPGGVACVRAGNEWQSTRKPRPAELDEWTHYLHEPDNNAVSHDTVIDQPRRLQWIGGPRYSRQHDHMSAISAMVTAGGRQFYIFDEANRISILTPPKRRLVARDAFNGTVLWKREIQRWHTQLWPLKSGPQMLPRRLVATADRVFVTLNIDDPVSVLDAATGKTLGTFTETGVTEEILHDQGALYLVTAHGDPLHSDPRRSFHSIQEIKQAHSTESWGPLPRTVMSVDAHTGAVRWRVRSKVTPMTLALAGDSVYFHDGEKVVCLDSDRGEKQWESPSLPLPAMLQSQGACALVPHDDVVVFAGSVVGPKDRRGNALVGLSAKDGHLLWRAEQPFTWQTLRDVFIIDGAVWGGAMQSGSGPGTITGRDLHTGEVVKQFDCDADIFWFHHRCYRAKATEKFLLYSRNGIEFVDFRKGHWMPNHWVRGGCLYGIMPANGMVYNPPHPCACYSESKLYGFNAIASARRTPLPPPTSPRLERGPAYGSALAADTSTPGDWPTYRHDNARSGVTPVAVPAQGLKPVWRATLGGRLTPPTVAAGRLYLAAVDRHTVYALDASTGKQQWSFTADGRVDSPPTIWRGRVYFGSADGRIYCLRARDGALVWRFRAAPDDLQLGSFDQLESVWPTHGSALIQNGVLYCVAGRSMFLDGGMRMLRLDPESGKLLSENVMDDRDPNTGQSLLSHVSRLNMPVAMSDVLASDGRYVYMRSLPFRLDGKRKFVQYVEVADQQGDDVHLFSPTGFLDDTMWHRTYWVYGRAWASGAGGYYRAGMVAPAGRLLVVADKLYGYGRKWQYYRWTTPLENTLYAVEKSPELLRPQREQRRGQTGDAKAKKKQKPRLPRTQVPHLWDSEIPIQVCAMTMAGGTLFVAGPDDVLDEEAAVRALDDPKTRQALAAQGKALDGLSGATLAAVSPEDGTTSATYHLDSLPVFDGLVAAAARLYITNTDGSLVCLTRPR